jgi:chorismate lyase/3-hydroxybenzoate synthase
VKSNTSIQVSQHLSETTLMSFQWGLPVAEAGEQIVPVPLEVLAGSTGYAEHWSGSQPAASDSGDGYHQVKTDQHLVLIFSDPEADFEHWVSQTYRTAYQAAQASGFDHLLRTWNYLYDINGDEQGLERYQLFCVARHRVMEELAMLNQPNPAATAIGCHRPHNVVVFLFSRTPGQVIENKRQTPAWQYPRQYAPKQPRFSRALIVDDVLFCSGTASVVGHETVHLGDLSAQFDECLNNVQVLIEASGAAHQLVDGMYRFYLRDADELPAVMQKITDSGIRQFVVLHGAVCRENLLIECEVVFQSP